jgi:serine/threonine protein kinase
MPRVEPRSDVELERFLREARAASRLRHPNICPVFEVGRIDKTPFLVMALISGRTLAAILRDGSRMPQSEAVRIVRKLALALAEAHRRGIIHRDLKPANVLIDEAGEPVVTDFGLARREHADDVQLTQAGDILGTPAYMSPEQARGDLEMIGPATDIELASRICQSRQTSTSADDTAFGYGIECSSSRLPPGGYVVLPDS